MKQLIVLFILFFSTFGFSQQSLSQAEITKFKENVVKNSEKIVSLEADFTQNKHLDFMEKDIKSSGKLYFKSGNLKWEYTAPYKYHMILKNGKMYINDNGKKKEINMSSSEMLKELSNIMAGSIQGKKLFNETRFSISYYKTGNNYSVTLTSKDQTVKKYIKQIEVGFDGSTYLITKVKVIEPTLDYTQINFSNQKKNTDISDAKFTN